MRHHVLEEHQEGMRTIVAVFDPGEEAFTAITQLAESLSLQGSSLSAVGAFQKVRLGWFNPTTREFRENRIEEQVELLSFNGNISEESGKRHLHAHVVLGCPDGTTRGGHLIEGIVNPTLELVIRELPAHLCRRHDPKSGLMVLRP
jgi:hypothetical protein